MAWPTGISGLVSLLLSAAAKGCVVLLVAMVLSLALRRASAATRHLLWFVSLVALVVVPIGSVLLPVWRAPVVPAARVEQMQQMPPRGAGSTERVHRREAPAAPVRPVESPGPQDDPGKGRIGKEAVERRGVSAATSRWPLSILAGWGVGAVVGVIPLIVGVAGITRVVARAKSVTDPAWHALLERARDLYGLRPRVRLAWAPTRYMPMTWGVLRPTVLLPAEAGEWPVERQFAVLTHELAHVKRLDCLTQVVAQVAAAFHWFNPLAWLALRQLRAEREQACDDCVLRVGIDAGGYARHLLEIAQSTSATKRVPIAAVAMARTSTAEARVLAILDDDRERAEPRRSTVLFALGCGLGLSLPLGALQPVSAASTGRWRASLPHGIAVELIGVSRGTTATREWWRPDGSRLNEAPYERLRESSPRGAPTDGEPFEIAVRLSVPESLRHGSIGDRWTIAPATGSAGAAQSLSVGRANDQVRACRVVVSNPGSTCTVRFGVAAGGWDTRIAWRGQQSVGNHQLSLRARPAQDGNDVVWTFSHKQLEGDCRAVAVDREWRTHAASSVTVSWAAEWGQRASRFAGLRLADIVEFRVQTRPFHWVEFRNVSLRSGGETRVTAHVMPAKSRGAVAQWAAVSDARAGRQARTVDLWVTGNLPKILDLETGKQLDFPRADGEKRAMEAVGRMASGDLVYTGRSRRIVCVRGAASGLRLLSCEHGPDVREYKFPKPLPSSLVVKTRKGEEFCVTMIHAGPGGCRLEYFPVTHGEAEAIAQEAAVAAGKADRHAVTSAPESAREERSRQQLGTLEVFVSDSTYGRPIVGATVPVSHLGTAPRRKLTTDKDGLAVASLAPGRWHVSPTRHVDHPPDRKFRNITIVAGETCRLEVKLEQLPVVEGVVLDPAGLPVSGAVVRLMPNGTRAVQSGVDGEFEVTLDSRRRADVLDDPCMLVVRHLKRGLATAVSLGRGRDVERGTAPATVTLCKGVSVAGRVTDSAGRPLSRVKVFAYLQMPEVASSVGLTPPTGGDGRYEIDAVPVGQTYYVSALGPKGYGTRSSDKIVLTQSIPEQIEVPDLLLLRADADVSGSVLDSMGRPVAGARVYVSGEGQPRGEVTADALGRFAFDVCPGPARISASWRAGSVRERIVAPAQDLKLVLKSAP